MTVSGSEAVKKSDFSVRSLYLGGENESFTEFKYKDFICKPDVRSGEYLILCNLVYESYNGTASFNDFYITRNGTPISRCYTGIPNVCTTLTAISNIDTGDNIGFRVFSITSSVVYFSVHFYIVRIPI